MATVTRLIVEFAVPHFGVADSPAGLLVDIAVGDRGVALATSENREQCFVQLGRRGVRTGLWVPWLSLAVIGRGKFTVGDHFPGVQS